MNPLLITPANKLASQPKGQVVKMANFHLVTLHKYLTNSEINFLMHDEYNPPSELIKDGVVKVDVSNIGTKFDNFVQ